MATKPVKFYSSAMAGAPALSGSAGALVGVLNACLVDGFNTKTVTSVSISTYVLTANVTAHGFVQDQVVIISGANESTINGEYTITSYTTDSFTAASGTASETGTGTISVKAAPAGWTKTTGTNLSAYRPSAGNRFYLRVDDAGTTTSRIVAYESMTDVNTGTNPFPTAAQVSGGAYWAKSTTADATARSWYLFADDRFFYFIRNYNTTFWTAADMFGDFVSSLSADGYGTIVTGANATTFLSTSMGWQLSSSSTAHASQLSWFARAYTQAVGSTQTNGLLFSTGALETRSGCSASTYSYPSPISSGLMLGTIMVREGTTAIRCPQLPGIYVTPQYIPLAVGDKVTSVPGLTDRTLLVTRGQSVDLDGRLFFDITGPWR